MTPQENETWAEVTWKPRHGPDDTDATGEQIREWALACQAEFSKDPGPFHVEVWAKPGLRLRVTRRVDHAACWLAGHGRWRMAMVLWRIFRLW